MTLSERWLLPDGVDEVLPPHASKVEATRRRLLDLFSSWGYELVITPFVEYLESLLVGTGSDLDLQTFKLVDQLSGRTLGVRADMTPQVARIDAHHLKAEGPVRLCYIGSVLRTLPDEQSGNRCPVQVGAELYGHAGYESDCEVLQLMLAAIQQAGIEDVFLDVGHVAVYRAICAAIGLEGDDEISLRDILQRKAKPELTSRLDELGVAAPWRDMLAALPELNGPASVLERARDVLNGAPDEVGIALSELEAIQSEMTRRGQTLNFDLGELRGFHYHTGVVFSAFAPGRGYELARGGRYDRIGEAYGNARPATGFSTDLLVLAELAMGDADESEKAPIEVPWVADSELDELVDALRKQGERVVRQFPNTPPSRNENRRQIVRELGSWVVRP